MALRILLIEDNKNVADVVTNIMNRASYTVVTATSVGDALNEYRRHRFDVTILDGGIETGRGIDFINALTPAQDATSKERAKHARGCGILFIQRVGQNPPSDNILLKKTIPFPFTTEQLTRAVTGMVSDKEAEKAKRIFEPLKKNSDPTKVLQEMDVTYGKSYLFFQEKPQVVRSVVGAFASSGYDMFLITASRPKVAKERMGLDRTAEVYILGGPEYQLGSMVQATQDFIEKVAKPVIAIDDLDSVINHCGLDRTLRALSALLRGYSTKSFTFMTSVNGRVLSDSTKEMLSELMIPYETEV